MMWKLRMTKARRLKHEHLFREITMEKGVADIQLMNRPAAGDSHDKEEVDGGNLNHGGEGVIVVTTSLLAKPLSDQASFVTGDRVVSGTLDAEDPLTTKMAIVRLSGDENPGTIAKKSLVFLARSLDPLGMMGSFSKGEAFDRVRRRKETFRRRVGSSEMLSGLVERAQGFGADSRAGRRG